MRSFLSLLIGALLCGIVVAEESKKEEALRKLMVTHGWSTEGLLIEGLEGGELAIFKRDGKRVGYYHQESIWSPVKMDALDLSGVTRVVYGAKGEERAEFVIDEADEIAIWVAAYQGHMEQELRFGGFVPTSDKAGFQRVRDKIEILGSCRCPLGLRFYNGEKPLLEVKGHLSDCGEAASGMRNKVLQALVQAKLPKPAAQPVAQPAAPKVFGLGIEVKQVKGRLEMTFLNTSDVDAMVTLGNQKIKVPLGETANAKFPAGRMSKLDVSFYVDKKWVLKYSSVLPARPMRSFVPLTK